MPHLRRAALWLSLGLLFCAPSLAAATPAAPPPIPGGFYNNGQLMGGMVEIIGYDSITGLPCHPTLGGTCVGTGSSSGGSAPYAYTPVAGGQYGLTVASSTSLTVPTGALFAFVQVVNSCVNWRPSADGAPTTSVGQSLCPGGQLLLSGTYLTTAAFIVQGSPGVAPVLNVGYAK